MASVIDTLTSRKTAIALLLLMVSALAVSAFLPSRAFLTAEEWQSLAVQKPSLFWLASRFSTPELVKSPLFAFLTLFLFLSTLCCTIRRMFGWERHKASPPARENSFSFAAAGVLPLSPTEAFDAAAALLRSRGWELDKDSPPGLITAQRGGGLGFWGSVVFHWAIVICLLAALATYLYGFNGQLILTEGIALPLHEAIGTSYAGSIASLPNVDIKAENLKSVYKEGHFKYDFSGVLHIMQGNEQKIPFKVNEPAKIAGLQFSLQQFGFSPRLVIKGQSGPPFDYHLNLRHEDGDYFPLDANDLKLFVVFFPQFDEKDGKIATLSREPVNPRLLLKIMQAEKTLHRAILAPGEELQLGSYTVHFAGLKNWASMSVSREPGLAILMVGLLLMTAALFVRFLSNERRIELNINAADGKCSFSLEGNSRYYPASLEREILKLAEILSDSQVVPIKEEM